MNSNKKITFITYGISLVIFLLIGLWGTFFLADGDDMGFVILNFYGIMPMVSLISALILGLKNVYLKWLYPLVFGILGFIIVGIIFNGSWDLFALFFALVPALFGLIVGIVINKIKK